jgi:hypothetical protein
MKRQGACSSSFDDEHGLVVNHVLITVFSKTLILLYCVIEQRIANLPGRCPEVLAHDRLE